MLGNYGKCQNADFFPSLFMANFSAIPEPNYIKQRLAKNPLFSLLKENCTIVQRGP